MDRANREEVLVLFEHYLCGLYDGLHCVSHFEFHLIRAALCNHALNQVTTNADDNVGHYTTELNLFNLSNEFVACR